MNLLGTVFKEELAPTNVFQWTFIYIYTCKDKHIYTHILRLGTELTIILILFSSFVPSGRFYSTYTLSLSVGAQQENTGEGFLKH